MKNVFPNPYDLSLHESREEDYVCGTTEGEKTIIEFSFLGELVLTEIICEGLTDQPITYPGIVARKT